MGRAVVPAVKMMPAPLLSCCELCIIMGHGARKPVAHISHSLHYFTAAHMYVCHNGPCLSNTRDPNCQGLVMQYGMECTVESWEVVTPQAISKASAVGATDYL